MKEAINYHIEVGVDVGGEVTILGNKINLGAKITTINWDTGKNEPYVTFGEIAAELKILEIIDDKQ